MQYPKYETLAVSPDATNYTFVSTGPKGNFNVGVAFTFIQSPNFFNLGFGVLNEQGETDDIIILDNGDRNKILATVAGFVKIFFESYPDALVLFSGSTIARTRLYRRAICLNYDELQKDFIIFGVISYDDGAYEIFDSSKEYEAFLVIKPI